MINTPTDRICQSAMSEVIFEVYVNSVSGVPLPAHGCWLSGTPFLNIESSLGTALDSIFFLLICTFILKRKRIIKVITTTIEVLLTFIRFTMTYKTQKVFGDGIRNRISHMQSSTRLLYVFYRDGTLLFIP